MTYYYLRITKSYKHAVPGQGYLLQGWLQGFLLEGRPEQALVRCGRASDLKISKLINIKIYSMGILFIS